MASISISALASSTSVPVKASSSVKWSRHLAPQSQTLRHPFRFSGESSPIGNRQDMEPRRVLIPSVGLLTGALLNASMDEIATAAELLIDLRVGSDPTPKSEETVVVDWDSYNIGDNGRIFEARNKTKGGSFEGDDKDFLKFTLGAPEVIPAFEEAVSGMALGGIRRVSER